MMMMDMSIIKDENEREIGGGSSRPSRLKISKFKRQMQYLKMLLLPFIPIFALLVQTASSLIVVLANRLEVNEIEAQVTLATDFGKLVTRLQLERGDMAFYAYTNGSKSNLQEKFQSTNETLLEDMSSWVEITLEPINEEGDREVLLNKTSFLARLNNFRDKILENNNNTVFEIMTWYMNVNSALLGRITRQIQESDKSGIWRYLISFKNLIYAIENIGVSAIYGLNYFGRGHLSNEAFANFIKYETLGKDLLNSSLNYVPYLKLEYQNLTQFKEYGTLKQRTKTISNNRIVRPSLEEAKNYYVSMTSYIDKLRILHSNLRRRIKNEVQILLEEASSKEAVGILILVIVCCVSPVIIILVRNAVETIQNYSKDLILKANELKMEQRKSDALLFQLLPPSIAIKMKQKMKVDAEYFDSVTIYFSDIVGFTKIASTCSPLEVCSFLNSIYKAFDDRIECYDVYKVETCGDAYMVASGIPERCEVKHHVSEISTMALDLLHASSKFKIPHSRDEHFLEIRIGIHVGSCGAGIVGTKMPRFCLFGDTVNIASRMESTGEASKIHITSSVNDELTKIGGFKTERRGLTDVKGKGMMETFWLTCKQHKNLN